MTNLNCTVCGAAVDQCACPDLDDRLRAIAHDPEGEVMFKWCLRCDRHFARCGCVPTECAVIVGGHVLTAAELVKLRDGHGRRVVVDLHAR